MSRARFMVLMYHNLAPVSSGRYSVGIDAFRAQLSWLRAEGYTVDGFRELQQRLNHDDFPERYVVLTFDDGHKSNLKAAQILRQFDAQATFFITKLVCQSHHKFMDDHEIAEISRICSVGSHGVTHRPLSRMNSIQIRSELLDSKRWLEDLAGYPVETLSAPGGFLDSRVVRHAVEAGYSLIGNSVEWWNDASKLFVGRVANRVEVAGTCSMHMYRRLARGDASYLLRRRLRASLLSIPKRLLGSQGAGLETLAEEQSPPGPKS